MPSRTDEARMDPDVRTPELEVDGDAFE